MRRTALPLSLVLAAALCLAPLALRAAEAPPSPAKGPLQVTYYFLPG